ncbi:helix-turn-helix domain-containing protein [Agrobacterium tumefaciens]|uniref:helix-turn-helix domain-containing protein n=1 Tax=Agrobacterium tumefaciens TaxID=358 RepID=UPI001B8A0935
MPKKTLDSLTEIQKLVDQASPALAIARTFASIDAPAQALKDINKRFSSNDDLMKSLESTSQLARRLTQHSDLAAKLTEGLPKIDLHLPNVSATIKASLPRPSADIPATQPPHVPLAPQKPNRETLSQELVTLDSIHDLGRMVRRRRQRRKQSQQEFADLAGVGRRFLSELENGKPTLEFEKVLQVARAAGISLFARDRSL